jgi:hypothetical protein
MITSSLLQLANDAGDSTGMHVEQFGKPASVTPL